MVVVRAEEKDGPKLTFKANDRAALGFTEADSAGQTNIFAVEVYTFCLIAKIKSNQIKSNPSFDDVLDGLAAAAA